MAIVPFDPETLVYEKKKGAEEHKARRAFKNGLRRQGEKSDRKGGRHSLTGESKVVLWSTDGASLLRIGAGFAARTEMR